MVNLTIQTKEFEYFLLVFVRMMGFMNMAPFFGQSGIPMRFKLGLSIFLAYMVYHIVPQSEIVYNTLGEYAVLVIKEAVVGLIIGMGAGVCMQIVSLAGRIIDMEMGLSAASLMDSTYRDNMTISGVFLRYVFSFLLLTTGMYRYVIRAIIETYTLIPVNGAIFGLGKLLESFISFMSRFFLVAFQIALPVFAVITLMNVVLAILAKVAPQMNLFAVGMQIKIFAGFAALYLSVELLPVAADYVFKEMKIMIVSLVEAMM